MPSKTELIKFILTHSDEHSEKYLETLSIESLVIIKVSLELKIRAERSA